MSEKQNRKTNCAAFDLFAKKELMFYMNGKTGATTILGALTISIMVIIAMVAAAYFLTACLDRKDMNVSSSLNARYAYDSNFFQNNFDIYYPIFIFKGNVSEYKYDYDKKLWQFFKTSNVEGFNFSNAASAWPYYSSSMSYQKTASYWDSLNLTCKSYIQTYLINKSEDPKDYFCLIPKSGSNFYDRLPLEGLSSNLSGRGLAFDIRQICLINVKIDLTNYEQPFAHYLDCQAYNLANDVAQGFHLQFEYTTHLIETEQNLFFGSNKARQMADLYQLKLVDTYNQIGFTFSFFYNKQFYYYQRSYATAIGILSKVNGIWGLLELIASFSVAYLIEFQTLVVLYEYLSGKESDASLWDYLKSLFRSKPSKEKIEQIQSFVNEKFEYANILNSDESKPQDDSSPVELLSQATSNITPNRSQIVPLK